MARPFKPAAFDHLVLRVRDVEKSIQFYEEVVGCDVDWRRPDLGLYHLRCGNFLIDLVDLTGPLGGDGRPVDEGPRNVDHFCLRVEPFDEAAIRTFLAEQGIETDPAQDRYGALGTAASIYFHDLDGNQIEIKAADNASA